MVKADVYQLRHILLIYINIFVLRHTNTRMNINTMILNYYFPEKGIPKFNNCFLNHLEIDFIRDWRLQGARIVRVLESNEQRKTNIEIFFKTQNETEWCICFFYEYPIFLLFFLFFLQVDRTWKIIRLNV